MRPDQFQQQLLAALSDQPGISAQPAAGAPGSGLMYGIHLTSAGKSAAFQIVGRLAPGDRHDQPSPRPVTGTPPDRRAPAALTDGAGLGNVEDALAAAVTRIDGAAEVASVNRYSARDVPPKVRYGLRVDFHDQSSVFVQLR